MPFLTIELDDVDYAKLRERSLVERTSLRHYAADVVTLTLNDASAAHIVEMVMQQRRITRKLVYPPSIDALIGQVELLVCDVAPPDFDPATWVVSWLKRPLPALGLRRPDQYLDTDEGRMLLKILIAGMVPAAFWFEPASV